MLYGPSIMEFLIPLDSLIVWFIFSFVIFFFFLKKIKIKQKLTRRGRGALRSGECYGII
jgi:hypothetical protein